MNNTTIALIVGAVLIGGGALYFITMGSSAGTEMTKTEPDKMMQQSPAPTATPALAMEKKTDAMAPKAEMNIVETAQAAGSFKTLLQAATAAGLAETLATTQGITVFAPTDAAFAKVPKATLDALLADPKKLAKVLTYHVVSGEVMAKDVVKLKSATTLEGSPVSIKVDGSTVMINTAKVVTADVAASNGVIHIIDTVLLPANL